MSLWETNNKQSKLLHLLYGVDVTQYKTEEELNERLSELKEEKTSIIENMIVSNILENYDVPLDKCNAVEIGPGAGIMLDWLAPQINHLYCVDISETILNGCKEQNKQHKNVSYNLIENLEFSDLKNIDFVYSQSVFIHLSILDFYLYFKELHKVLKPNGLVYIDIIDSDVDEFTLQEDEFQRQLQLLKNGYVRGVKTLYHVNSGKVLNRVAKELGYELVWRQSSIFNPSNVSLIYKKI
jgi:2-polyprenyl-3-methyl-5-hydroxy-6-metoxy-1,4-benzoquinol methylase